MKLYGIAHENLKPLLASLREKYATGMSEGISDCEYVSSYIERSLRTRTETAALSFLASAVLLAKVLSVTRDEQLRTNSIRKPYLVDGRCFFSISHDEEYTIMVVADDEVGCDIERIQVIQPKLAARNYPAVYLAEMETDPSPETATRLWTQLEAVLKAEGTGFTCSLKTHPELLEKWKVNSSFHSGYAISIAYGKAFDFPDMQILTL